jgi:hypothetical protein
MIWINLIVLSFISIVIISIDIITGKQGIWTFISLVTPVIIYGWAKYKGVLK